MEVVMSELTDVSQIDINKLHRREHEVFESIRWFVPWQRCQHGKQIVAVKAYWSDDAPFTVTTGRINHTQWFERTVHVDGTFNTDESGRVTTFEYNTVVRCSKCEQFNTLETKMLPFGNLTTCNNPACDYEDYFSIGD
jgi:hypothetical protein